MQRHVRGAIVRKSNTKSFMFGVALLAGVPVFCSLANAPVAGALSLTGTVSDLTQPLRQPVRDLTAPVTDVLRSEQPKPVKAVTDTVRTTTQQFTTPTLTTPTPSPAPAPTSSPRTAPATTQQQSSASTTPESTAAATPVEPAEPGSEAPVSPVEPAISPLRLFNPNLSLQQPRWGTFQQANVASATFTGITPGSPRAPGNSWLQPSPTGWRILGIEWFWWLLVLAPVILGVIKRKKLLLLLRSKYGRVDPK